MKTITVEDLGPRLDEVGKWFAEGGGEIVLTHDGVAVATMAPPPPPPPPVTGKADWARRFRERPPVGRQLNKEETEAFYESLKRDF